MKESASYQVWIGQHDMMMPRCIVMNAVSAQIRAMMHQIHHSWVPQIYILDSITSHIFEIHLSSILQQIMSKKSTYIWGANKKKDDDNISNRQLLLMQAMLLVGHGCCEHQIVFKEATSTSWPDAGSVSLVLSRELNPGHLGENQVSKPLDSSNSQQYQLV